MIPFIYRKWYYRLATGLLLGLLAWLMVEVLLNIRYRYFDLFSQPVNYLYAGLFGMVMIELMVRSNRALEKRRAWEVGPGRRWLLQTLIGIAVAILLISLLRNLLSLLFFPGRLIIFSDEMMIFFLVMALIIVFNLVEAGLFLNERYHRSLAEMDRFRKENAEYQFEMLKLQLNPHFLFNSLNTLSSLVYEDAGKASDFIRKLSDVYRYVLDNRNKELVYLREEMDFINSFSFLLGIRFQGMIDFRFDISNASFDRRLAPMTLQLLVENAVKHNVVSVKRPLTILISADGEFLQVSNDLQLREENSGTGMGLKNITSRYAFLTDRKVEINREENSFTVKIPLI